jgi:phosphoribosyl 1,2-cyclic phosphodiesterase
MYVKCLGSGSKQGNCYALTDNDGKILLLDCGISLKDIKSGIGFKVSNIVGCLITHSHL